MWFCYRLPVPWVLAVPAKPRLGSRFCIQEVNLLSDLFYCLLFRCGHVSKAHLPSVVGIAVGNANATRTQVRAFGACPFPLCHATVRLGYCAVLTVGVVSKLPCLIWYSVKVDAMVYVDS